MPPPLLIGLNPKLRQATYSDATELSVAPQAKWATSGLAGSAFTPSGINDESIGKIESHDSPSIKAASLEEAVSSTLFTGSTAPASGQRIADPVVAPSAFIAIWQGSETSDLDDLTGYLVASHSEPGGGSGGNGIGPGTGEWGYHLDNNDGYELHLQAVTFSGVNDNFTPVYHDLGSQEVFAAPHWLDENFNNKDDRTEAPQEVQQLPGRDMGEPISYKSSVNGASYMKAQATIILDYIPPGDSQPFDNVPNDKTVYVRGVTSPGPGLPSLYTNIVDVGDPKADIGTVKQFTFQQALMPSVFHWADMQIDWQFVYDVLPPADTSPQWVTFNSSHNANYVTLNKSRADKLFLTLADRATLSADRETTEPGAVAKMWSEYESCLQIRRSEDDYALTYYGNWLCTNFTASALLDGKAPLKEKNNGQCGAFAELWQQELYAQGIQDDAVVKEIVPVTYTGQGDWRADEGMLICNWTFDPKDEVDANVENVNLRTGKKYYWLNSSSSQPPFDESKYLFGGNNYQYQVRDNFGIWGQFNNDPKASFFNHFVVLYKDSIYDSSYGKKFATLKDWEDASVQGFFIQSVPNAGANAGNTIWYIRKNKASEIDVMWKPMN